MLYGLRLGVFTWFRNHSNSYAAKVDNIVAGHRAMPTGVKVSLWFMCTWLQTFHLMGIYFAARRGVLSDGVIVGAAVMLIGLAIEAVADAQKQRGKEISVNNLITEGLFSRIRHPNYLGEILVQAGLIIAGIASVAAWNEVAAIALAPAYIILLMIAEALRTDQEQRVRYGGDPAYGRWRGRSGALLPRP
jgi:steroid 5-alpha reductase family enzyme